MTRFFLIFLLAVLPFQLSWAAVAAYCQDEKAPVSYRLQSLPLQQSQQLQHFGHHTHADNFKTASAADSEKDKPAGAECEMCHLSCAKFFLPVLLTTAPLSNVVLHAAQTSPIYLGPVAALPEEPDWIRAA